MTLRNFTPLGCTLATILAAFIAGCTWWTTAFNTTIDVGTMMAADRSLYNVADDYVTKSEITGSIFDEALLLNVSTDVYQGMVMLTGIVKDEDTRDKAEKLARRAARVREVFNEIQVNSEIGMGIKTTVTDLVIESKLKAYMLFASGVTSINFRWRAVNGIVYFMGIAKSRKELDKILSVARLKGVKKIVTHIFLSDQFVVEAIPTSPTQEIDLVPAEPPKAVAKPTKRKSIIGSDETHQKVPTRLPGALPPDMPTYFDRSVDELH